MTRRVIHVVSYKPMFDRAKALATIEADVAAELHELEGLGL